MKRSKWTWPYRSARKLNFKTPRILPFIYPERSTVVKSPIARSTATRPRLTRTDLILRVRDLRTGSRLTARSTSVRLCILDDRSLGRSSCLTIVSWLRPSSLLPFALTAPRFPSARLIPLLYSCSQKPAVILGANVNAPWQLTYSITSSTRGKCCFVIARRGVAEITRVIMGYMRFGIHALCARNRPRYFLGFPQRGSCYIS